MTDETARDPREVDVTIAGEIHTLRFPFDVIRQVERDLGDGWQAIVRRAAEQRLGADDVVALFRHGTGGAMSAEEARGLFADIGLHAVAGAVSFAVALHAIGREAAAKARAES